MKKIFAVFLVLLLSLTLTSCNTNKTKKDTPKELTIKDTINIKGVKVKINSITRKTEDCLFNFDGKCSSKSLPKEGEFLVFDITVTNDTDEKFTNSTLMLYALKDKDGNKGVQQLISTYVVRGLDGTIWPKEKVTGTIVDDIKKSDSYNFYFRYDLLTDPVKLTFKNTDIK